MEQLFSHRWMPGIVDVGLRDEDIAPWRTEKETGKEERPEDVT